MPRILRAQPLTTSAPVLNMDAPAPEKTPRRESPRNA